MSVQGQRASSSGLKARYPEEPGPQVRRAHAIGTILFVMLSSSLVSTSYQRSQVYPLGRDAAKVTLVHRPKSVSSLSSIQCSSAMPDSVIGGSGSPGFDSCNVKALSSRTEAGPGPAPPRTQRRGRQARSGHFREARVPATVAMPKETDQPRLRRSGSVCRSGRPRG